MSDYIAETLSNAFPTDGALEEALKPLERLKAERLAERPRKNNNPRQLPRGLRKRGRSFVAFLTHPDGRKERRTIGNVSLSTAIAQRQIWLREIAEGRYIKPVPRTDQTTFKSIAEKAVEHSKRHKRCWDGDEQRAKIFIGWWGGRPADSLTPDEIDRKFTENLDPEGFGWSKTTVNEYRNSLSHIFTLAIDRGEVVRNPASKVKPYKLENARTRELSSEEETRLRASIRKLYPAKEVELDLLLHSGARVSNWYGTHKKGRAPMEPLQWSAVNLDWKIVTFPRSKPGPGYQLPLNQVAMDALKVLLARSSEGQKGPVIRKPSGLELQSCRKWFEKSCEDAVILDLRIHDLRHTFATRLRRNKIPIEDIAALLGHGVKKHSMTARYAHPDLDRLREAVDTLVPTSDTKSSTGAVVAFRQASTA
jgi:integrase